MISFSTVVVRAQPGHAVIDLLKAPHQAEIAVTPPYKLLPPARTVLCVIVVTMRDLFPVLSSGVERRNFGIAVLRI
jgi:hypothetical protein